MPTDKGGVAAAAAGEPVAWADVPGYEGLYQVSSAGDLRRGGAILAKNKAGTGYIKADLHKGGKRAQTYIHRLVATVFLGAPEPGQEVNHKNGDKADNRVENLEWVTKSEQFRHSCYVIGNLVTGVIATHVRTGKETAYPSVQEAVRAGFHSAHIHRALKNPHRVHRDHRWREAPAQDAVAPPAPAGWRSTIEALQCAEYALTHPNSDQQFALNAVRSALAAAPSAPAPAERQSEVAEQLQRRVEAMPEFGNHGRHGMYCEHCGAYEGYAHIESCPWALIRDLAAALRGGRTADSDAASVSSKTAAPHLAADQGGGS